MIRNKRRAEQQRPTGKQMAQIADLLTTGLALHRGGELQQARATYRFVLTIDPRQADALHLLGVSYLDDEPAQAEQVIRQAVALVARNPLYYFNLGLALRNQQKFDEAVAMFDKALRRQPDYREAHLQRGVTLRSLGRREDAVAAFGAALALKPDLAGALKARADTWSELGRHEQAVADYDALLAITPGEVGALNNRGLALLELRRPGEALASFKVALAISPDAAEIVNSSGCALRAIGLLEQSLQSFARAVALKPDYVEALVNQATALQDLGRFDEALACYAQAQSLRPDFALAHWNESTLRLLTGDLATGFAKAEWRGKVAALGLADRAFTQPLWLGDAPLAGKTILAHADMGLGDTIHFARYLPLLAARGARVVASVQAPLRKLIATIDGVALCVGNADPLPAFDLHCPMASLPLAFGTTLATIPSHTPYLAAPAMPAAWQARLGASGRPKIGLVWSGNARHANDRARSIAFETLRPLLAFDASFIALQTEARASDEAAIRAEPNLVMAGELFADFSDTAAVVAGLDLVISVDTSVAHLAGALGRPVWILLPFAPDWRWLLGRDDSPWYPTARLFRQDDGCDWTPVMARVGRALAAQPWLSAAQPSPTLA